MDEPELKQRTKRFALRVIKLVESLPQNTTGGRSIGGQLFRAGTSVGANYRAACRGRSRAEFISKLGIVEEEADETAYWIELLIESGMIREGVLRPLLEEANEIVAITVASRQTAMRASQSKIANQKSKIR